ncbi:MAG TPA: hypothetical protein VMS37_14660 [Verrucomicrobiae bacterium]|nr:hypothetical protein [Verrucomicrobiae bacterium]
MTFVIGIDVYENGTKLSAPPSAFADLGNPSLASAVATGKDKFTLTIQGGDASVAYTATFMFKGVELQRRKVASGEFPEDWEETRYTVVQGDR